MRNQVDFPDEKKVLRGTSARKAAVAATGHYDWVTKIDGYDDDLVSESGPLLSKCSPSWPFRVDVS